MGKIYIGSTELINTSTVLSNTSKIEKLETNIKQYGNDWVDLGLPSGTLWRNRNIGAENPEDIGYLFTRGNITPYQSGEVYEESPGYAYNNVTVPLSGDAARVILGPPCRIPSFDDCNELIKNTTIEDVIINGIRCAKFVSNTNGKYLIFNANAYSVNYQVTSYDTAVNGSHTYKLVTGVSNNVIRRMISNAYGGGVTASIRAVQ